MAWTAMRKGLSIVLLLLACFFISTKVSAHEEECYAPISKDRLLEFLKKNKITKHKTSIPEKISITEIIERIKHFGVRFHLSASDELEIRNAANKLRLKSEIVSNLIESIRHGYKAKVIVLVANIENDDPIQYGATRRIYEQLSKATKQFPEVCVDRLGEPIVAIKDTQAEKLAAEKGRLWNAGIVIWGRLEINERKARVYLNFKPLESELSLKQEQETITVPREALQDFMIQEQLWKEMKYLTLLTVGVLKYELGDYDGAIERFKYGLRDSIIPDQIVDPGILHFYEAIAFYRKGVAEQTRCNYEPANTDYENAIREGNISIESLQTTMAYYNLGNYHYAKWQIDKSPADYDAAIKHYHRSVNIKPNARAYYHLGNLHRQRKDSVAALQDYQHAFEADPNYAEAYNNRGTIYKEGKQDEDALKHFKKAIELKNDYADPHINIAMIYFHNSKYDLALAELTAAIDLIHACNCLGSERSNFTSFMTIDQDNVPQQLPQGVLNDITSDPCKALGVKPTLGFLYKMRGLSRVEDFNLDEKEKDKFRDAIGDFSKSIENAPYFWTYYYRARACVILSMLDKAEKDYAEAIRLSRETFTEAHLNLSDVLILMHRYDEAIAHCKVILSLDTEDARVLRPNAYVNQGEAYYGFGQKERGLADIQRGLELLKDDAKFWRNTKTELIERFGEEIIRELEKHDVYFIEEKTKKPTALHL